MNKAWIKTQWSGMNVIAGNTLFIELLAWWDEPFKLEWMQFSHRLFAKLKTKYNRPKLNTIA